MLIVLIGDAPNTKSVAQVAMMDGQPVLHHHEGDLCIVEKGLTPVEAVLMAMDMGFTHLYVGRKTEKNLLRIQDAMLVVTLLGAHAFDR